jgi:hypothetical protein
MFAITSERTKYQLSVGTFSGSLWITNFIKMLILFFWFAWIS